MEDLPAASLSERGLLMSPLPGQPRQQTLPRPVRTDVRIPRHYREQLPRATDAIAINVKLLFTKIYIYNSCLLNFFKRVRI